MKKILLALVILCSVFSLQAQVQGKIRVAGNFGIALPTAGYGMSIDFLDVRYNILDNLNAGIKFGFGFNVRDIDLINPSSASATVHTNFNTMIVGDYYFHNGSSAFAPFVGAGIGSFSVYDIKISNFDPSQSVTYNYTDMPTAPKVIGGAIRGGFELGRLRLAMEYYMIPKTAMFAADNIMQTVGTSNNSYLTVNLGFVLGGGKWRR
jgi:hypothetical protein